MVPSFLATVLMALAAWALRGQDWEPSDSCVRLTISVRYNLIPLSVPGKMQIKLSTS